MNSTLMKVMPITQNPVAFMRFLQCGQNAVDIPMTDPPWTYHDTFVQPDGTFVQQDVIYQVILTMCQHSPE